MSNSRRRIYEILTTNCATALEINKATLILKNLELQLNQKFEIKTASNQNKTLNISKN